MDDKPEIDVRTNFKTASPNRPLEFVPNVIKNEFRLWPERCAIEKLLAGEINSDQLNGQEISSGMANLIEQLRSQKKEWETSIALADNGNLLLQVNPSSGKEGEVDNHLVTPPEGVKVFAVHNHPPEEKTGPSYPFFLVMI